MNHYSLRYCCALGVCVILEIEVLFDAGTGRQQLRLRTTGEVPAALRARRPEHGLAGAVGDRSVQTASPVVERRSFQAHLRHIHRLQEHCFQDRERVETVTSSRRV